MRIGSLFSGAGGLDMAVEEVFGGEVIWQAEVDKAASKVLAYRFPCAPNLGDITQIDWKTVEPVDVLCGGFPCQDVSAAGKRAGIKAGTRSGLWSVFADAIEALRPPIVVIENVRGLLSAEAHRQLEPAEATVGDRAGRPVLRAAGAVLGDLADLGYDAQWATVAAGDVGAPHRRERVFIVAHADGERRERDFVRPERYEQTAERSREAVALLPTPTAQSAKHGGESRFGGGNGDVSNLWQIAHLLPTPTAESGKHSSEGADRGQKDDANLWIVARRLLPTPAAADGHRGQDFARADRDGSGGDDLVTLAVKADRDQQWGKYEPAIRRWESLTRLAPAPTEPNKNGNPRLSAAFSEWMMGWPDGWVTDPDIGISRNDQLRIVGNGVCPQQAIAALRYLLTLAEVAA